MTETLLQTKLYIPILRSPNLVHRPQLIKRFNQALQPGSKLTLVSAPAGFGKTTLVVDWVHKAGTAADDPRFAWLSLDEGDNDLTRFLTYLVAALQTVDHHVGRGLMAALQSPAAVNVEVVLTTLLNEINVIDDDVVLILDDYHVIESLPVDQAITFLLDHLPPQMHLVIAGRIDPSLPLSRLRARGQLTEIRADNLRFSLDEAAAFLNQADGFKLSSQEVAALETRTEGWIAGLQLAALSIQGFERSSDIVDFVNRFTGSDRYIQDYLADEVLQQQSTATKVFLLQTSILSRLNSRLCDAVTGKNDSQTILESIESANLFTLPLDNERRWFRYHHLFANLLAHRLHQTFPDRIPGLHRRASMWYESEGYIDEAIHHAQASGDKDRLEELLEEQWQEIVHRGAMIKLRHSLDSLGPKRTGKSAPLSMAYCWIHVFAGENKLITRHLKDVREALKEAGAKNIRQPIKMAVIPSLAETMDATICLDRKQYQEAKEHAQKAITLIPDTLDPAGRRLLQGAAAYRLAEAHRELGEYDQACAILLEGLQMLQGSENYFGAAATLLRIVTLYQKSGKTEEAIKLCEDTLAYIEEHHWGKIPPSGMVHVMLADLQMDSGDYATAGMNLELGRELAEQIDSREIQSLVKRIGEKLVNSTSPPQPLVEPLSPRELEVLQLVAQGLSNREISEELFLALDTVKGHNRRTYEKLGVKNRTQAVNKAISLEIIPRQ